MASFFAHRNLITLTWSTLSKPSEQLLPVLKFSENADQHWVGLGLCAKVVRKNGPMGGPTSEGNHPVMGQRDRVRVSSWHPSGHAPELSLSG